MRFRDLRFKVWQPLLLALSLVSGITATEEILTPELFSLLEITNVELSDHSLEVVVDATQKAWLRKPGTERWEIIDPYSDQQQQLIAQSCEKLGFFSEVRPTLDNYTYCCILGATLPTAKARILFAKKLWESGVRFEEIVLLTGRRTLDERVDRVPEFDILPEDEAEATRRLWLAIDLPIEMRKLPVTLVNAPAGVSNRPNTKDTILEWIKRPLKQGPCLLVSNQPWVKYQNAVAKGSLPPPFETVGPKAHPSYSKRAAVLLDTVARWLYAENQTHATP